MEAGAGRRAFEPLCAWQAAPAEPTVDDFADRQLGVLSEQGNFERARLLLARRAVEQPDDAGLYLDAIRTERCAAPSGEAWQAWLSRALQHGAAVASALPALLPERLLRAYLTKHDIGWALLERQPDRAAARELLRLRLEQQLLDAPSSALDALGEAALQRAAQSDAELLRLAVAVLAGSAWVQPARVLALAARYGLELTQAEASSAANGLPELLSAQRLQPAWTAVAAELECPPPLERFVRVGHLVSRASARRLWAELHADLRARPGEHLRCVDAALRLSRPLLESLREAFEHAGRELFAPNAPPEPEVLQRRIVDAALGLRRDLLLRLWPGAVVLAVAVPAGAWLGSGPLGLSAALLEALGLGSLCALAWARRSLDRRLYRRRLRAVLVAMMVEHGVGLEPLAELLQRNGVPRGRSLAARARRDAALSSIGALAAHGRREPSASAG
jgi:hypothetical protein